MQIRRPQGVPQYRAQVNRATYSCTALAGTSKKGVLAPDDDGFYTVVLGAFNAHNHNDVAYYPFAPAKKIIDQDQDFLRRISNGEMYAERDHPKRQPGWSDAQWFHRLKTIDMANICCLISDVWYEEKGYQDGQGRPVVAVLGKIKPWGEHKDSLIEALHEPRQGVAFSIRSITFDQYAPSGVLIKSMRYISGWDWVVEPGMDIARKWLSPSLETLSEFSFDERFLQQLETDVVMGTGTESMGMGLGEIRRALEWTRATTAPRSSQW